MATETKKETKKELKPIEELYDLSQPIPKIDKPNKAEHEKELAEVTAALEALKQEKQKVQTKIDATMTKGQNSSPERTQLNALKNTKTKLIDEKKALRTKLDSLKAQNDKLIQEKKDATSKIKFTNVDQINKEIAKLQKQQETTSMSLQEEKKLIKEIDALEAAKSTIGDMANKNQSIDNIKEHKKTLNDQIKAKDKEIDEVQKQMDELKTVIDQQKEKNDEKQKGIKDLFDQREELRKKIGEQLKVKDKMRDEFREKNNKWYDYSRAVKAQRQMQYEEEKKKREEERAAYEAKLLEEELKKVPYEAEQALCDFLAEYLQRTYISKDGDENDNKEKKEDVVAVQDDPFAGLKPKKKDEEEFFVGGKAPKKKRERAKKQDKPATAGPFTLSVDIFEQFSLIQMNPPTAVDQVEDSIKALREKKEWYKQQPRGSVPTAAEIRKAAEKEAQKLKQPKQEAKPKKQGDFALASDDFAPLTAAAAASSVNASWGKSS